MQIAIDGPASAGKSTIAKLVAQKLSFIYIDTGAMYRACTLIARNHGLDYGDEKDLLPFLTKDSIVFKNSASGQQVWVEGHDASLEIRTPDITANVSQVSALPGVRQKMVEMQREMAKGNVIMDGRDIGTTVLPHADLKVFMIASVETRAKRRLLDYQEKGIEQPLAEIEEDIRVRDYKDSHRAVSPLKKASDAVELDTSHMSIPEVVDAILDLVHKKEKNITK
jgi:cytidylate kinase